MTKLEIYIHKRNRLKAKAGVYYGMEQQKVQKDWIPACEEMTNEQKDFPF
ncbi:MAG: hypothetical protein PHF37_05360 [Phycisphaerae bacterium]|nr:hypothetical protein [Phycisphaerae bacterium]